jgi:hypothetical protein
MQHQKPKEEKSFFFELFLNTSQQDLPFFLQKKMQKTIKKRSKRKKQAEAKKTEFVRRSKKISLKQV